MGSHGPSRLMRGALRVLTGATVRAVDSRVDTAIRGYSRRVESRQVRRPLGCGGPSTSPKGRLTADVILPLCCLQTCRGRGDGACSRLAAPGHEQRLGERLEECNRKGGRGGKERRRGKRREGTLWPFGDSPRGRMEPGSCMPPTLPPTLSVSSLRTTAPMAMFLERW